MRLILIHGYVEAPSIFDNLAPMLLPATMLPIDLKDEFARWNPTGRIDARQLTPQVFPTFSYLTQLS